MGEKLTPEQRILRARAAAHDSWARTTDRAARSAPGGAALLAKIDAAVPDDESISDEARQQMICSARRAYYTKLAAKSARARRRGMRGLS